MGENQERIREWLSNRVVRVVNDMRFNWDNALCAECGNANNPVFVDYPHVSLYNHDFVRRPEDEIQANLIQAEIDSLVSTVVLWSVPPRNPHVTEHLQRGRADHAL